MTILSDSGTPSSDKLPYKSLWPPPGKDELVLVAMVLIIGAGLFMVAFGCVSEKFMAWVDKVVK